MTVEAWTRIRRSDRAMSSEAKIEELLIRGQVGNTATCLDGQPFLNPNLYWYDPEHRRIYFHTAAAGRTGDNIAHNPRVCFSVAEMGRLLPASTALEFSTEYASVVVFGRARLVESDDEKRRGLQGLLDKYFPDLLPGEHYRPIVAEELARTAVFAIEIEGWSGKEKVAAE